MIDNITHNIFFFIHPVITFQQFPSNAQHFFSLTGRIALTLFFKFSKTFIVTLLGQWEKKIIFTTSTPKYNQLENKRDGKLCHV